MAIKYLLICLLFSFHLLWASTALDISHFPHAADQVRRAYVGGFGEQSSLVFENPAALALQDYPFSLSTFNTKLLDDKSQLRSLSMSAAILNGVLSFGWMQYSTPTIPKTTSLLRVEGLNDYFPAVDYFFSYRDTLYKLSYATSLSAYLSIGANFSYFKYDMDVVKGQAFDMDFALFSTLNQQQSLSLLFKNFLPNTRMSYKNSRSLALPKQVRLGYRHDFTKFRLYSQISLDYLAHEEVSSTLDINPAIALEIPLLSNPNVVFSLGYSQRQNINKKHEQISMGIGTKFKGLSVDFAFENSDYKANDKHYYLSLSYQFGQKKTKKSRSKAVLIREIMKPIAPVIPTQTPQKRLSQKDVRLIAKSSSKLPFAANIKPSSPSIKSKPSLPSQKIIQVPKERYIASLNFKPATMGIEQKIHNTPLDQPMAPKITSNILSNANSDQSSMALFILLLSVGLGASTLLFIRWRS